MTQPSAGAGRVLAVGLDSADWSLIETWAAEGVLPEIAALLTRGGHCLMNGANGYTAETPWTMALTGCWPSTTGYWSPVKYHPDYRIDPIEAYGYGDFGHFYDYCAGRQLITFDVPQARASSRVDGQQILAWGAHSPQGPSHSQPADLFDEIVNRFGSHPLLRKDDILIWETDAHASFIENGLIEGIARRTDATLALMAEKPWDLLFVVYGEPHSAGHGFWHLSRPEHPLYKAYAKPGHDPLRAVYQAVDAALGRLKAALPEDTHLVLFSQEGMKTNSADLPSWLFLPELLYRMSFGGRSALAAGPPPPPAASSRRVEPEDWMRALWTSRTSAGPLTRFLTHRFGLKATRLWERLFAPEPNLRHPLDCPHYGYMPPLWYQPAWPRMRAFALPSFSEGNIRLNVRGRETNGLVEPKNFRAEGEALVAAIDGLRDPETGQGIVREVLWQRTDPFEASDGPDADIIILWQPRPAVTVESPDYGRIGPAPMRRSGDHHAQGFLCVTGPGIAPGPIGDGTLVDLAPTILDLMGVRPPNHFEGHSRLAELRGRQA